MTPEPITCEQSLKALASLPAAEIQSSGLIAEHTRSCPDCSRVAAVVVERERSLGLALDSLTSRSDPARVAETAFLSAERHGTARFVKWLLIGAMAATAWFALDHTIGSHEREIAASMQTETIGFSCLTPEQAESVIEPYVRTNGHAIYFTKGILGVTVRALPAEIARARRVISGFDVEARIQKNGACPLPPFPGAKP